MLMNFSIGFYALGVLLMIIIAILFGLMLITDNDRLATFCEKLFWCYSNCLGDWSAFDDYRYDFQFFRVSLVIRSVGSTYET